MNKTEWDAMVKEGIGLDRNRPADVVVAKIVMGWEVVAGNKYFKTLDERLVLQQRFRPTTDRNACALVEDEIERRGLVRAYSILLLMGLKGEAYLLNTEGDKTKDVFEMAGLRKEVTLLDIRCADPDL